MGYVINDYVLINIEVEELSYLSNASCGDI
jgi:hypothetical protein